MNAIHSERDRRRTRKETVTLAVLSATILADRVPPGADEREGSVDKYGILASSQEGGRASAHPRDDAPENADGGVTGVPHVQGAERAIRLARASRDPEAQAPDADADGGRRDPADAQDGGAGHRLASRQDVRPDSSRDRVSRRALYARQSLRRSGARGPGDPEMNPAALRSLR